MSPKTILVVDDEPQIRRLVRNVLEQRNYQVLEAEDGQAALAICERNNAGIDLLLTDIVMPNLDGIELARRIFERNPGIPVIYMSGKCEMAAVDRDVRQRGFRFIKKPFALAEIVERVGEALGSVRKGLGKSAGSAAAGEDRTA